MGVYYINILIKILSNDKKAKYNNLNDTKLVN